MRALGIRQPRRCDDVPRPAQNVMMPTPPMSVCFVGPHADSCSNLPTLLHLAMAVSCREGPARLIPIPSVSRRPLRLQGPGRGQAVAGDGGEAAL